MRCLILLHPFTQSLFIPLDFHRHVDKISMECTFCILPVLLMLEQRIVGRQTCLHSWADTEEGTGCPDPPPEKSQTLGFLSNTGQDPLKNHKATNPAFYVGPLSARQRNTILIVFRHLNDISGQ